MNMTVGRWGPLLALLLISGCSSAAVRKGVKDGETVEAEGWAAIDPKDAAGTRQRAMAEAQRKAVEKATGVFLTASTQIDAAITVRQRIIADAKGYIDRYEVLEERTDAGFYKTKIRAFVLRRKAGENEQGSDILAEAPPESPKVALTIAGIGPQADAWSAGAVSAVRSKLSARGFSMAEAGPKAADARSRLVIRGEVRAYPISDPRLGAFFSYRAKVNLEVTEPATGRIWKQSQEASAIGLDPESASSQAVENAGLLIGTTIAADLTAYLWKHL